MASLGELRQLVSYLREDGAMTPESERRELTPLEALIADYREWLVDERGLGAGDGASLREACGAVPRRAGRGDGKLDTESLTGAEVSAFLSRECGRLSLGAAKGRVAELRSLLRFLHLRGLTEMALAEAVPPVAGWRETSIPQTIPRDDIMRLLGSCDRSQLDGARDHAILMLLARLGLRSIEVARLELGDLDWRAGEIAVRGKARRATGCRCRAMPVKRSPTTFPCAGAMRSARCF